VISIGRMDTIEMRSANWLSVKDSKGQYGLVFGGYLSDIPIPSKSILGSLFSTSEILSYLKNMYSYELIYESEQNLGLKNQYIRRIYLGKDILIESESSYEWYRGSIRIKGLKLYDLIHLIDLCIWFEENPEMENFKKAYSGDKNFLTYNTYHSDPERKITISVIDDGLYITEEQL